MTSHNSESDALAPCAWQPIETAPLSAMPILTFNEGGRIWIETGYYVHNMLHAAKIDEEECYYTHWMPLPAAPGTQAAPKAPAVPETLTDAAALAYRLRHHMGQMPIAGNTLSDVLAFLDRVAAPPAAQQIGGVE